MKVLIGYASVHGATGEVAEFMSEILVQQGYKATVSSVDKISSLEGFDAAVLGTAIHGGMWLANMVRFINKQRLALKPLPLYMFATCVRVVEKGGYEHAMEHYMRKTLTPSLNFRDFEVFAGRIQPEDMHSDHQWTLSRRYDGKLNTSHLSADYRNWEVITRWALRIADDLHILNGTKSSYDISQPS
jgi:menaquinone-dependent protoporphyrinogen oxidase